MRYALNSAAFRSSLSLAIADVSISTIQTMKHGYAGTSGYTYQSTAKEIAYEFQTHCMCNGVLSNTCDGTGQAGIGWP
jgi:hypothetical protein